MTNTTKKIEAGATLFKEGDISDKLYFIKEGTVEIFRTREGVDIHLGDLVPGDVIGTVTFFSGEPRTASARVVKPLLVQEITHKTLTKDLGEFPTWVQAIIKDTVGRLKYVDDRLVESKLEEKRLAQKLESPVVLSAQLCQFFDVLQSLLSDGASVEKAVEGCAKILMVKQGQLEGIYKALLQANLFPAGQIPHISAAVTTETENRLYDFVKWAKIFTTIEKREHAVGLLEAVKALQAHSQQYPTNSAQPSDMETYLKDQLQKNYYSSIISHLKHARLLIPVDYPANHIKYTPPELKSAQVFLEVAVSLFEVKA